MGSSAPGRCSNSRIRASARLASQVGSVFMRGYVYSLLLKGSRAGFACPGCDALAPKPNGFEESRNSRNSRKEAAAFGGGLFCRRGTLHRLAPSALRLHTNLTPEILGCRGRWGGGRRFRCDFFADWAAAEVVQARCVPPIAP